MASLDRQRRTEPDGVRVRIAGATLRPTVADDSAERRRGLAGRSRLGSDRGMLFVFRGADRLTFWMKGMRFPVDIVWIRQRRVLGVSARVPPPAAGAPDDRLPTYSSPGPADRVLEAPAGWASGNRVERGDRVTVG